MSNIGIGIRFKLVSLGVIRPGPSLARRAHPGHPKTIGSRAASGRGQEATPQAWQPRRPPC
eukprot:7568124-Pyramimonas_sp.AAC.1